MKEIILVLPVLSANKYWRPAKIGARMTIVPTKEAKKYRLDVAAAARAQGCCSPIAGRVRMDLVLYPHRPVDWKKRKRDLGAAWDDGVQCIDLANCEKVLSDALNGVVFVDDSWIREITMKRMEPDEHGLRVVVRVLALAFEQPQIDLIGAAS